MEFVTPEYVMEQLESCKNISADARFALQVLIVESVRQDGYGKPMPWIGMYITFASLFCILAIVADLVHGLRTRKLWFPCRYFTLNSASVTVIAVAMKLPMDLNNLMPGHVDQAAKLGSMAFMCAMMANLLPSLATMDNKELLTNVVALGVLIITLVVNVSIQIKTGVIYSLRYITQVQVNRHFITYDYKYMNADRLIKIIFVVMLLMLLMIHTCSALAILKSKHILESKYQAAHEIASKDQELQQPGRVKVDKLKQYVSNYWIMAGTSSPQSMTVCSVTTSASGVICVLCTITYTVFTISRLHVSSLKDYGSDYNWSIPVILVTQSIGAILGTIAPLCRCFAALNFKLSIKWIRNHINIFKVESYWTQRLCEWKRKSIPFPVSTLKSKIVIQKCEILVLSSFIGFQKTVVITCKMIALIAVLLVICVLYFIRCGKWIKAMFSAPGVVLARYPEQLENNQDHKLYVLQVQDDMEVDGRALKGIKRSMNHLIQKAEKQQPHKLIKLLEESSSSSFEGVGNYDSHHVPALHAQAYPDCWSLPLVTLTTIAISLPNIPTKRVDMLLSSVSEGLAYVTQVEESLNATDDYINIQKAAKMLWLEVVVYKRWLGNKLQSPGHHLNTTGLILQWFKNTAKNMIIDEESENINQRKNDSVVYRCISANSMYRITESILLSYNTNIEEVSQDVLFKEISSLIADILAACLTNLPQIILMKCHTNVIEKREASVRAAAQLLGETMQIINRLQSSGIPSLNPDELPFIDKWRTHLQHPSP